MTFIHAFIPLVGGGVEETPASCILRRHHTAVQTAQHRHHIVLDGARHCEVLQELGSAEKPSEKPSCQSDGLFFKVWADLFLMSQKRVAQPNPVAVLMCESGFGRERRNSLLQRPSCQVISWLASLGVKESPLDQSQPVRGRKGK